MSVEDNGYTIKFSYLDSALISNHLIPDDDKIGNLERSVGFYTKLEESILREGFRNPLLVVAVKPGDIRIRYGGSRLMVAHKHKMEVPCIITDFQNCFPDAEILFTLDDVRAKFKDEPKRLFYQPQGLWISGCEHMHLMPKPKRTPANALNQKSLKVVYLKR